MRKSPPRFVAVQLKVSEASELQEEGGEWRTSAVMSTNVLLAP